MTTTNETTVLRWIAVALLIAAAALIAAEYFHLVESTKAFVPLVSALGGGFLAAARAEWLVARSDDDSEER